MRAVKLGGFIFSFLPDASGSNLGSGAVVKRERFFFFGAKVARVFFLDVYNQETLLKNQTSDSF